MNSSCEFVGERIAPRNGVTVARSEYIFINAHFGPVGNLRVLFARIVVNVCGTIKKRCTDSTDVLSASTNFLSTIIPNARAKA